jgi:hypothetical protein
MFGDLLKATVGIITSPIDIVADIVTLGGTTTDKPESYTATKAKQVMKNLENATDPDKD